MIRTVNYPRFWQLALTAFASCVGCETSKHQMSPTSTFSHSPTSEAKPADESPFRLVSQQIASDEADYPQPPEVDDPELSSKLPAMEQATLLDLESLAIAGNPTLRRMQHEAGAAWAKTGYVSKLPDPTLSTMFFTPPMNFEPDRQLAEVQVMQMIPSLHRLAAEKRRAHLEALAARTAYEAELLRIVAEVRATWFKLYVIQKQIEVTESEQVQLESIVTTANTRLRTGDAQQSDVLMASLELSGLQEQLIRYRQQRSSTTAELNRLIGRDVLTPVEPPTRLDVQLPPWDLDWLRQIAANHQPELNRARLRAAAARWGIQVARLKQHPDLSFGLGWVAMDAPNAVDPGAGRDSLTLSVSGNLPVARRKYNAMISEASRDYHAAQASEEEVSSGLDALLADLWEQAKASQQTVELYEGSILPQARQTFEADQQSLINNTVSFDRVIRNYRSLLNLELSYHQALGQLATAVARLRRTAGIDLVSVSE